MTAARIQHLISTADENGSEQSASGGLRPSNNQVNGVATGHPIAVGEDATRGHSSFLNTNLQYGNRFLCDLCRGITEENTRFDFDLPEEEAEKRVYPHHQNLLALKESSDSGCALYEMIFDEFVDQCGLSDQDLRIALSEIAALDSGSLVLEEPLETINNEYANRVPEMFMWTGSRVKVRRYRPSGEKDRGRIFISRVERNSPGPRGLKIFYTVMAGRPSSRILQLPIECRLEAFVPSGRSQKHLKLCPGS
jgi:hypothetical protein